MDAVEALALAVMQGISELFPVSSLGHAVIVPAVLQWSIDQHSPAFLPFIVVLHLGTATALLIYFWRDWFAIARGILDWKGHGAADARNALWLIIVATLPAVAVGFLFEKLVRGLFASPVIVSIFLIINGFMLLVGDRLRYRAMESGRGEMVLGWKDALMIGLWQCAAFLPGISRSGAAMIGGLLRGLHHTAAARFSFLIGTPIIFGAAVLEVPKLIALPGHGLSALVLIAGVLSGITAYASTAFLMRYFRKHDFEEALVPFAIYCWAAGALALIVLIL